MQGTALPVIYRLIVFGLLVGLIYIRGLSPERFQANSDSPSLASVQLFRF